MSLSTMARMAAVLVSGKLSQVSLYVCVCVLLIVRRRERADIYTFFILFCVKQS